MGLRRSAARPRPPHLDAWPCAYTAAMSIETDGPGRFCNQVFRSAFASILAKKLDLAVAYAHAEVGRLGVELFSGAVTLPGEFAPASEAAVLAALAGGAPPASKISFRNDACYFQSRPCSALLRQWLRAQETAIVAANPFAARFRANSDAFLHVRLGDVPQFNPGADFFRKALARVAAATGAPASGFISSDSPDHPLVLQLLAEFPGLRLVVCDDLVRLIQFASTCAHVVLSHGSFSAVIGFLAFHSTVYYAPYNTPWCGDMFSQPDWILVS